MIQRMHREAGLTLLEILLVMAIGGMLVVLGFKQYLSFRHASDIRSVAYNVDVIFNALGRYYQANCRPPCSEDQSCTEEQCALFPAGCLSGPSYQNVAVSFEKLKPFITSPLIKTNLVNETGEAGSGYVAQFNYTPGTRVIPDSSPEAQLGTIIIWQAQVSVPLNTANATLATTYQKELLASCLSSANGDFVTPCASGSTGFYAVFAKQPSNNTPNMNSNYNNFILKQFKQMYTTYPILELTNGSYTNKQFYTCGS